MNREQHKEQQQFLASAFAGRTVMVSGATGLIGSRIVEYLCGLDADVKVVVLYKDEEKKNALFAHRLGDKNVEFVRYDILKPVSYEGTVDHIVHCAGLSGGSKVHLTNPMLVFDTSYHGMRNMLTFGTTHGTKSFVYVSTYEMYGAVSQEEKIGETDACLLDPMQLRNIYAECKRMCEAMAVAVASKSEMRVCAGRLTSTFGSGVKRDDPRFFAEFARCIADGRDIVLKSTGGTVRSYLDADDAASAFLYILAKGDNCQAYNLTNMDNAISIRDIAKRMIELSGSSVELRFDIADDGARLGFRPESVTLMDASKLESLGWSPVYSLDDTLKKLQENF